MYMCSLATSNLDPREVKSASAHMKRDFADGIPPCGSDALRLALVSYMNQGRSVNMDIQRVVVWSHFGNKLWNAQKFIDGVIKDVISCTDERALGDGLEGSFGDVDKQLSFAQYFCFLQWIDERVDAPFDVLVPPQTMSALDSLTLPQRWILHRLAIMVEKHARAMERYVNPYTLLVFGMKVACLLAQNCFPLLFDWCCLHVPDRSYMVRHLSFSAKFCLLLAIIAM
jgi:hypothetical protein